MMLTSCRYCTNSPIGLVSRFISNMESFLKSRGFILRANLGASCFYSATLKQFEKKVRYHRGRESMDYDYRV